MAGDLQWGPILTHPWPHIVMYPALPWPLYATLEAEYPTWEQVAGKAPRKQNARYDMNAAVALTNEHISPVWKSFLARHVTPEMWETYRTMLGIKTKGRVGVRHLDDADILMDCQIGVNSPVEQVSSVASPHIDNPCEIMAGLLYMPVQGDEAGGDLVLYRHKGAPKFVRKCDAEERDLDAVKTVPYRPNQAIFFVNDVNAVHGVTPRQPTTLPRRLVNFCVNAPSFRFNVPR